MDAFSFLLAVKAVIIVPAAEVCLNTGAELAVTSINKFWLVTASKVSVTFTGTWCASVSSPLFVVLNSSTIDEVSKVTTPFEATFTNPAVYESWAAKVNDCPCISLAVRVWTVEPDVKNSAIFTFAAEVNWGASFG